MFRDCSAVAMTLRQVYLLAVMLSSDYVSVMRQGLPETFGDAVRDRRLQLGLSQRKLAAKMTELGVPMDATAVTRIENNQREPRYREGVALCDFLQFDGSLYVTTGDARYEGSVFRVIAAYSAAADALLELIGGAAAHIDWAASSAGRRLYGLGFESASDAAEALLADIWEDRGTGRGSPELSDGRTFAESMFLLHEAYTDDELVGATRIVVDLLKTLGLTPQPEATPSNTAALTFTLLTETSTDGDD
jgi:transcriptional regulator with XRE-family HTH domain